MVAEMNSDEFPVAVLLLVASTIRLKILHHVQSATLVEGKSWTNINPRKI